MERLLKGLAKFQAEIFPKRHSLFQELASQQNPHALFITCSDSRVIPSLLTQTEPGELFLCRNAGNIVPPYGEVYGGVSATIEYAVAALKVRDVIVCGHSDCGAMHGILHPKKVAAMPAVSKWLRHGEVARRVVQELHPESDEKDLLALLTEQNVVAQLANLRTHPSVAARLARGDITLNGWVYHIHSGRVDEYDAAANRFRPIVPVQMAEVA